MELKKLSLNVNNKTNRYFKIVTFTLCILFGVTLLIIIGNNKSNKNVDKVQLYKAQIETTMDEKMTFINTLANGMSSGSVVEDIYAYVDSMVALYDDVSAVYVCVKEDGTVYQDGIMTYMSGGWVPPEDFIVSERAWYQGALETDGVFVSEPYVDEQTGNICITLSRKITQGGNVVGVAGLDMYMDDLVSMIEESYKRNDYVFLVSKEGIILTHPDEKLALTAEQSSTIDEAYNGKYNRICSKDLKAKTFWDYKGGLKLAVCATSDFTGWKIVDVVSMQGVFQVLIICIIYTLVIGLFTSWFIKKRINKEISPMFEPLEALSMNVGKIAEGELGYAFEVDQQSEEVNALSNALNETIGSLQGYINEITQTVTMISNKNLDFTVEGEFAGDYSSIKDALTNIVDVLNACFVSINEQAETVNEFSRSLADTSEYVAEIATSQSNAVMNASEEMNALTDNMEKISLGALEIKQNSDATNTILRNGNEEMKRLVDAMDDIVNCFDDITEFVGAINEIASQTNLLSLNASIEAARAGEAGRGFAIVAEEIGDLSLQSEQSSNNINAIITKSLESIERGKVLVNETYQIIQESVDYSATNTQKVEDIVQFVVQQKESATSISKSLRVISEMSENNAASAQENSAISNNLGSCAEALSNLIGEFNLRSDKDEQ